MCAPGNLGLAVAFFLYGPWPLLAFVPDTKAVLMASLVVLGVFAGPALFPTMALMHTFWHHEEDDEHGHKGDATNVISGLFMSAYATGQTIGPLLGGALIQVVRQLN